MLPFGVTQPKEQPRHLQQLSRLYLLPFPKKKSRRPYNQNAPRTGSHSPLEPSGPVHAWNWIDLLPLLQLLLQQQQQLLLLLLLPGIP